MELIGSRTPHWAGNSNYNNKVHTCNGAASAAHLPPSRPPTLQPSSKNTQNNKLGMCTIGKSVGGLQEAEQITSR